MNESDPKAVNYLRALSENHESKIFISPWEGVWIQIAIRVAEIIGVL